LKQLLKELLCESYTQTIDCDVFTASAYAIRWMLETTGPTDKNKSKVDDTRPKEEPDSEQHFQRMALAVGDENAVKMMAIASRNDISADEKMQMILKLDKRFVGKDSNDWATLLRITPSAVRQTDTWKSLRSAANRRL
jgi:hypothetical protein